MEERLQWIKLAPAAWAHWEPLQGGLGIQAALALRYPAARCLVVEPEPARRATVTRVPPALVATVPLDWAGSAIRRPGRMAACRWSGPTWPCTWRRSANPAAALAPGMAPDGFLMFSCLGPDTLRAVREAWSRAGWPEPAHAFTDMHDWGDMLVGTGFAEPVMDMERITLTFASPQRAAAGVAPARPQPACGAVFGVARAGLARPRPLETLARRHPSMGGSGAGIRGHLRPCAQGTAACAVQPETRVSLDEMRRVLRHGRVAPGHRNDPGGPYAHVSARAWSATMPRR
jgi:malonyl-CoA O-methyltransferase